MQNINSKETNQKTKWCILRRRNSHANIKGAALDYPRYLRNRIDDILKTTLLLMYGNVQFLAEAFFDFLEPETKKIIQHSLKKIASDVGFTLKFEPDNEAYAEKISSKMAISFKFFVNWNEHTRI